MTTNHFTPHHMNATPDDLAGNGGIGRYILLPGSDGRAQEISRHFDNLLVKNHPRGHNLYLGTINYEGKQIDVATIPTGMGCPSMEIILHELFKLGGKRFLRVGTAGSLQSSVKMGDIVNAQASVRDEHTTSDYVPITVPAVASFEGLLTISNAAKKLGLMNQFHTGTVHCKSSFYAREFGVGPKSENNKAYIRLLNQCGILATEMETSALFIQSQLFDHELKQIGNGPEFRVIWGAILAIVGIPPDQFVSGQQEKELINNLIMLSLETIRLLFSKEVR